MTGKLASNAVLAGRLWRNGLWSLAVIVVAMVVGIAGYMFFGNMGLAQAFANAAMILSGMGPLDKLTKTSGFVFEGVYALVCGLVFFAVAGLVLAPLLHRMLHRFHIEDQG
jgi:sterol desaturase/sphingolipid hydroxylase (fatty acid hydroxylase superfamily)